MTKSAIESRAPAQAYVTSDLAAVAPYLRNALSVRGALHCVLVASLPCLGMALYNTGYQVNLARAGFASTGWRTQWLSALGLGASPASALDCIALGALFIVPLLASVWLAGAASEWGFARARGRRPDHRALPMIALLFSLALPATLSLWQAALGAAVGIAIGKEIFGGLGRNFVSPVVVGLAFLYFTYPGSVSGDTVWVSAAGATTPDPLSIATRSGVEGLAAAGVSWRSAAFGWTPGAMGETSALACLLGAAALVFAGVASWRVIAGGVLGLVGGVLLLQTLEIPRPIAGLPWYWHPVTGSFAFGLVFLATDPVASATTNPGRWLYGALIGAFVAGVRLANPAHQDGVVMALLMGSVVAPLLDRIVAYAQLRSAWLRERQHG